MAQTQQSSGSTTEPGKTTSSPATHQLLLQQFVILKGGEYLVAPSTDGLTALGS